MLKWEYMKICFKCKLEKNLSDFYKHPDMPDGHVNKCKECNKKDVRNNYASHINKKQEYDRYRQRHSISRIFNHRYSLLKQRCEGKGSNGRVYKVTGSKYLTKEEWIKWCYEENNYKKFIQVYNNWVQNDFQSKLSPSIDRINSNKSYTIDNIQWLSRSDNCKKYDK